jgi:hypothetical protein
VLADTGALATLSPREFRAGYAEVVKYGLIDDRAFFEWLEANWRAVFAGGPERARAIATSCRAKAAVVARDEFETGDRALLNLGHTFGHALERLTHYDSARLVHGEGVAIGMALAFRFSVARGQCSGQDAARVAAHLSAVGLPTRIQDIAGSVGTPDQIVEAMYQDKKVQRGALTFILARGVGESFIAKGVGAEDVRAFLPKNSRGADFHAWREPRSLARRPLGRGSHRDLLHPFVGAVRRLGDGADGGVAGADARAGKERRRRRRHRQQAARPARSLHRRHAARQHAGQYRLLRLHDQRARRPRRRRGRHLRHDHHDRAAARLRRGDAQDHRHQLSRPDVAAGGARRRRFRGDLHAGAARGRGDRRRGAAACSASSSARITACCPATRN